jgi:heterodisulfide reductase subunit C
MMENIADYKEIIDLIKEKGGDSFKLCYQCGKCDVVCPWNQVRNFSMRKLVREANFGMSAIEGEDIWLCTTCGKCSRACPRDVRQVESGIALRRLATEYGIFAATADPVRAVRSGLNGDGNPFSEERSKRANWAEGLSVKAFTENMEILYFPGCYLCYDPRMKKVASATSLIKQA